MVEMHLLSGNEHEKYRLYARYVNNPNNYLFSHLMRSVRLASDFEAHRPRVRYYSINLYVATFYYSTFS
jgi:hypothetical protein